MGLDCFCQHDDMLVLTTNKLINMNTVTPVQIDVPLIQAM